ncbi:MAG: indolepyruvate oxidoreductase subunit beta [SAR202 cluster bacterium]|jgi:indolepyruvate ferredoxin oxidoreductase beta subunit|nr:indolepyruvate oxidoreductase subunit beta [SAR202 cluster bacterium]MDP7415167.1 indolepyruvate oxidoreductase subunit beta [SAR202 cluster bacterium]MDP7532517.1 indolepyruvate oxidoreductase subunit beta [SAR202 cluster bacterium]|tara:strand:+ start:17212 stop:17841 length:630 start_codon:yes stop_codon:yes gene_type:complete
MNETTAIADPCNIVVSGVGGQGNVLASRLIGRAMVKFDYHVSIGETYGASQRGGTVMSHVRFSSKHAYGPLIPLGRANTVIGLEPMETLRILRDYGNPDVSVIVNTRPITPVSVNLGEGDYPEPDDLRDAIRQLSKKAWLIPATEIALEIGTPVVANVVLLGTLVGAGLIPITPDGFEQVLRNNVPERRLERNLVAFSRGLEAVQTHAA